MTTPPPPPLTIDVPGVPIPQGSLRSLGPRRLVHSNAEQLRPWREAVAWHLREAMATAGQTEPWDEPVGVMVTFHLPRPASAPRRRWAPDRKPDIDKLLRACLDALTASGAVVDDARVIKVSAEKRYGLPGMWMTVGPLPAPVVAR